MAYWQEWPARSMSIRTKTWLSGRPLCVGCAFINSSQDSVMSVVTRHGLEDRRFFAGVRGSLFFQQDTHRLWSPLSLLFIGSRRVHFPGVNRPDREADHFLCLGRRLRMSGVASLFPHSAFRAVTVTFFYPNSML
jgi:hypothetical protein